VNPFRFPQCLFAAALLAASAQAQNLDAIVMPPPEAPAVTQAALGVLAAVNKRVPQIDTAGLVAQLKAQPKTVVIDVRTAAELEMMGGYIDAPRFFNLTRGWLEFQIETAVPDKNTPIVVYCGVSQRSPLAADTLIKLGYKNVKNYRDGYFNWQRAGLPTLKLDKAPGTYANSGHNNNLSFVITDDGVLVVNAGDNDLLAQSLHEEIRKRTTQPVKYVVLENSQGHAMLGSNYWKEQGATIIAHRDTAKQMEATGYDVLAGMRSRARDKAFKTEFVMPDQLYDDKLELKMGSWNLQILHLGPSHSHGDTMVWLPEKKLVIAGDTAFHIRMLPIFEDTDTAKWIETWDKFEALGAGIVIPGHGGPTDMATVRTWTRDYLMHLRAKVAEVVKAGGSLDDAYKVDQSAYMHLHTADELARSNAGRVFRAMEFEPKFLTTEARRKTRNQ